MTIAIVGLGLIGTSVALSARRRWPDARILGVDRPERLLHPHIRAVCDLASPDLHIVSDADTIVLAAPIDGIVALIPDVVARARVDTLVTDVGSTKRAVLSAARGAGLTTFVGGHPMAGGETSGPGAARADLFDDRAWFLMSADPDLERPRVEALVAGLGATPVWTDAVTHDRIMAAVSHLPQVVASTLMVAAGEAAGDNGLRWAGGGLRDATRLAASPGILWESVLATNADELQPLLLKLSDDLRTLAGRLSDPGAVHALFAAANRYRSDLD